MFEIKMKTHLAMRRKLAKIHGKGDVLEDRELRETGITIDSMTLKHSESLAPVRLPDSKSPGLDLLLTIYGKKGFLLYCP